MNFTSEPQTFMAKIMNLVFSTMLAKSMRTLVQKDLEDIKAAVEAGK